MKACQILFVTPTEPADRSFGGALRSHELLNALRRSGDVCTLVMTPGGTTRMTEHPDGDVLAHITFRHAFNPGTFRQVRGFIAQALRGRRFDLVVVRYLLLGLYVRPCVAAPFVLDGDDLSKRHGERPALSPGYLRAALRKAARDTVTRLQLARYAHVWFVNRTDMAAFSVRSGSMLPNVVAEVPQTVADTVAGETAAGETAATDATHTVLFVGNLQYPPNIEAVDGFVARAWPLLRAAVPQAALRIVGKCAEGPAARWRAVPGVQVVGFVADLSAEYRRACVVIAPIVRGGGTQIKVLEALAHARATVVSALVRDGFAPDLRDGEHFVVARTPQAWADACAALLHDRVRARALGASGRAAVRQHYSVEHMHAAVQATLARLGCACAP